MPEDVPGLGEPPPEDEQDEVEEEQEDSTEDEPKPDAEATKWRRKAELREKKLRAAQAELAEIKKKGSGATEPDPIVTANARLVASEVRTQLAAIGVTDKADQRAVISVLNLGDVEVDDDGEVDSEAVEEKISELRRILAGKATRETRRTPRMDTRDRGGKDTPSADPDAARYARILGRGR